MSQWVDKARAGTLPPKSYDAFAPDRLVHERTDKVPAKPLDHWPHDRDGQFRCCDAARDEFLGDARD